MHYDLRETIEDFLEHSAEDNEELIAKLEDILDLLQALRRKRKAKSLLDDN